MILTATLSLEEAAIRLWDVLIVGAGPAGAMSARELARRGRSVLLVDRAQFPRWKVCGSCLNLRALEILKDAGANSFLLERQAVPLTSLRLAAQATTATLPLPGGVALSRERLDEALVESASAAGAVFLPGTYATSAGVGQECRWVYLRQGPREWSAAARIVIAADGLGGRFLAGEPGFRFVTRPQSRIGAGAISSEAPDFYTPGAIFMATGDEGYVGLVRLEDGRLDIAAALERSAVQHACGPARVVGRLLASVRWPAIGQLEHLAWRGTPGLTRQATRVSGERLFVVGDAAEYVEPFTGEGIAWALETAAALAPWADQAVQQWSPRLATRWQSRYRRLVRQRRTCRAAAFVLRSPVATRGLVGLLHRMPFLGSPVIRLLNRPVLDQAEPA